MHSPIMALQCSRCARSALLSLLLSAVCGLAKSTNRTIDDEHGDSVTGDVPTYSQTGWSQGSTCPGCFIQLDASQTFDGTWHDNTYHPGDPDPRIVTAKFTGTAVYVYGILANTVPFTTTFTNLTFALDGARAGTFEHIPTDGTDFQYNVNVYSNTNLANQEHTLTIETAVDGTDPSLVLFDYIIYTVEEADPSTPPPTTSTDTDTVVTSVLVTTTERSLTVANPPTTAVSSSPSSTTQRQSASSSPLSSNLGTPSPFSFSSASASASNIIAGSPLRNSTATTAAASTAVSTAPSPVSIPPSQRASTFPVAPVVGGTVGGVALLFIVAFFVCLRRRRRKTRHPAKEEATTPGPSRYQDAGKKAVASAGTYPAYTTTSPNSQSALLRPMMSTCYDTSTSSTYLSDLSAEPRGGVVQEHESSNSRSLLRPLPYVPISSALSAAAESTELPYRTTMTTPFVLPELSQSELDEKSIQNSTPESEPVVRRLPVPPSQQAVPPSRSPSTPSSGNVSVLRTQVAVLREELARVRAEQEMQRLLDMDSLPTYEEARAVV